MFNARRLHSARRSVDRACAQIADLAEIAGKSQLLELRAPSVSDWSIGEQVEHLRRSDITILRAVATLDTDGPCEGSPTLAGRLVLASGFLPRGRGRAPGATLPLEVDPTSLPEQLDGVRDGFTALQDDLESLCSSNATIKHPALGCFTALQMLTFAAIHHHHHLKIIWEIHRTSLQ